MFSLYEAPTPDETDTLQPKLQQVSLLGRCDYPKFQIKKKNERVVSLWQQILILASGRRSLGSSFRRVIPGFMKIEAKTILSHVP